MEGMKHYKKGKREMFDWRTGFRANVKKGKNVPRNLWNPHDSFDYFI
jgi:hypothetical protein